MAKKIYCLILSLFFIILFFKTVLAITAGSSFDYKTTNDENYSSVIHNQEINIEDYQNLSLNDSINEINLSIDQNNQSQDNLSEENFNNLIENSSNFTNITTKISNGTFSTFGTKSYSYSVGRFGTGMATGYASSDSYNFIFLSEAKGATRNAESESFLANIGFFDNVSYYRTVSIKAYSINPKKAVVGSTISLYISALNAENVWAKITYPNNYEQIINLINEQSVNFLSIPSLIGNYQVIFYAKSSTGAIASVVDYFELTKQTTSPSDGGSSGGGKTTTIIEKCTYVWDCTPWSLCFNGKQTRKCKNIGTCEGNESKPIEEMQCSESLFDIDLKLKDTELTENTTLKFKVDLTEKMGVEKIDTHIKYSIINKDGYEIFSQIETKAVERNLTFEKEISEIKLIDGEYILRVDILYGNLQRAFAEQKFKVIGEKIEIRESASNIQKIMELLNNYKMFIIIPLGILLFLFIKGNYQKRYEQPIKIISIIALLIILRRKWVLIYKKITESLDRMGSKLKKYPRNSIRGLLDKKVYSESGHYIGKVNDIILGENRIESLKIQIDKKHKFKANGAIINYKHIKGVSEIIIIDDAVEEQLEKL